MFRHGVAVAALALAMTCPLVTLQGSVQAQPTSERWGAAVFVRRAGEAVPLTVHVADQRSRHLPSQGDEVLPPLPHRKSTAGLPPVGQADLSSPAAKPRPKPELWSPREIAEAKIRCAKLLKGTNAVVVPQLPIRDGRCGTPAPIRLVKLGKVEFSPPALLNCEMVAALSTWLKKDLQPLAAKHLGARITKVEVMSDYSCRNVAGRKRLSEHAFADALDIRGFVTERGQTARVLRSWGKTKREIEEEIAAAKGQIQTSALDARKLTAAIPEPGKKSDKIRVGADRLNGPTQRETEADTRKKYAALGPQHPAKLQPEAQPPKPVLDKKATFLRAAHAAACRIFGTTLGPEANRAHRNHFHVDMAERKWKKICD